MSFLFIYLIKSSLSLTILFIGYELFFRREAYFRFSRYFLLFTLFLVIVLPLIPYSASQIVSVAPIQLQEVIIYSQITQLTLDEIVIRSDGQAHNLLGGISFISILLLIYLSGLVLKTTHFLVRLVQIRRLVNRSENMTSDGFKFVFTERGSPTYSFLSWIFIDRDLYNKGKDMSGIISHEKIHAQQGHTYDVIIAEVLTIIQWFNPFAYLLKKAIKENHEYLTDKEVINNYQDTETYRLLLLNHSSIIKTNILTHNFSYSLLKRRLKMMKKSKHPLRFCLGITFLATAFAVLFFACSSPSGDKSIDIVNTTVIVDDTVFTKVESMPIFPGGMDSLMKYLSENITYPEQAKKDSIQGRVFVNFVVEKTGEITSAKILRGIGGGCDKEAIRAIESMPDWTPGKQRDEAVRVSCNLPIKFTLSNTKHKSSRIHSIEGIDTIYRVVDVMPEFPEGTDALLKYLSENITYPETAKKEGVQGRVFVNFTIEKNGKVSNVNIMRGIGGGCDAEALRVVKSMPDWHPGLEKGVPVRVSYNLPVKFALN